MTAHPIFPKSRKKPVFAAVALLLVMVAVLLAAGCMGNGISVVTSPTPTPIQPAKVHQSLYWIDVDPISDKHVGDIFTINATTNLSAGDTILVQIYNSRIVRNISGTSGTEKVVQGSGGINTISFIVNSSAFRPDEYIVAESADNADGTLLAGGVAFFKVFPEPVPLGSVTLKPKNFIDWDKLGLPELKINTSMQPETHPYTNPDSEPCQTINGSIMLFSTDGIVRIFDKTGTQTAACYDIYNFHSYGVPSGSLIDIKGNVTTVFYGSERIVTMIHEA